MNEPDTTFRERLLKMETSDQSGTQTCRRDIATLFGKKLSVFARIGFGILAGLGLLFARYALNILQGYLPVEGMANSLSYTPVLIALFLAAAFTGLAAYLAIAGRFGSIVSPALVVGVGVAMTFFFIVIHTFFNVFALMTVKPTDWALDWRVRLIEWLAIAVLFFVTLISLVLILRVVYRLEYKTQEKLLEVQYQLTELRETLTTKKAE